jgi:hypothetical protein
MPRRRAGAAGALASVLVAGAAYPCDSTSCSLLTRGQNGVLARGSFRVDLSYRYTDMGTGYAGGGRTDLVVRPKVDLEAGTLRPGVHQERGGHEAFFQVDLGYGLSGRLTAVASLPLSARREYDISHFGFTARYDTVGLGDTSLGLRYAARPGLVLGVAAKVPTGSHREGEDYDGSILDPTLQPGTGSFDLVPAVQLTRRLPALGADLLVAGSYQLTRANDLRYRFGNEGIFTASLSRRLTGAWAVSLQTKAYHRARSRLAGQPVPSTGSSVVWITPGTRLGRPQTAEMYAFMQLPVYRHVNETQLVPRWSVLLGLSLTR